jgi:hypothetical protein
MKITIFDSLDLSQFCISEALQEARFRIESPLLVAARVILLIRGTYKKLVYRFRFISSARISSVVVMTREFA